MDRDRDDADCRGGASIADFWPCSDFSRQCLWHAVEMGNPDILELLLHPVRTCRNQTRIPQQFWTVACGSILRSADRCTSGLYHNRRKRWWTRLFNLTAELPYALPGVVMAIASLLLFLKPLPLLGFHIYNTIWIILYAYLARFFVLALRPTVSGLHQIDRSLEEAARWRAHHCSCACGRSSFPCCAGDACRWGSHLSDCVQ